MPLSQPTPITGTAVLIIKVTTKNAAGKERMTYYRVQRLNPHRDVANPAWRLFKVGGEHYDVHVTGGEALCDCKDFAYRRHRKDPKGCRHIAALRATGLLKE